MNSRRPSQTTGPRFRLLTRPRGRLNDDNNVDAPETYKLEKLVLLNILALVEFKLSIFSLLNVDNEFILPSKLVLVEFTLSIFNLLNVDNGFVT